MPEESNEELTGIKPTIARELFDASDDMTLKTEIPPSMVITLLRNKLIRAALDPLRTKSLLEIFDEEYKKIMVSFKRRGRREMLIGLQAMSAAEEEEEPAVL